METLKISLAAARVNKKIKQGKAAEKLGVMPQTLRNWESGKTTPSAAQFKKLCELYEIAPDHIFFGE